MVIGPTRRSGIPTTEAFGSPAVSTGGDSFPTGPGQVGFLGDEGTLTVVNSQATADAVVPGSTYSAGRVWSVPGGVTISGVKVHGGIDITSGGVTIIEDSVIEGDFGAGSMAAHQIKCNPSPDNSATLTVSDTTLRRKAGTRDPVDGSEGGAWLQGGNFHAQINAYRVDLSGTADGMQLVKGGTVERVRVHSLVIAGTFPDNTHNDGIMLFDGTGYDIKYSSFDCPATAPHANSAIFSQGGDSGTFDTCYFNGGGYCFYIETGVWAVRHCRWGRDFLYGNKFFDPAQSPSASQWLDNLHLDNGEVVTAP